MSTRIFTWNPEDFEWNDFPKVGGSYSWVTRAHKSNKNGDFFILIRTGKFASGLVAFGVISKDPYRGMTYRKEKGWLVDLKFDAIIDNSSDEPLISKDKLFELFPESKIKNNVWTPQSNGSQLDENLSTKLSDLLNVKSHLLFTDDGKVETGDTRRLVKQRVGQYLLRQKLISLVGNCELSGINNPNLLRASHIIPWKENEKIRGDKNNVLLLAVPYDYLFDNGYISFEDNGQICISPRLTEEERKVFSVSNNLTLLFKGRDRKKICEYLRWHRENLFKK